MFVYPKSFVPSVERVHLPRNKGGRPPRHDAPHPRKTTSPSRGSSVLYSLGKRGSAVLWRVRERWMWTWLVSDQAAPPLRVLDAVALSPATRCPSKITWGFSLEEELASAIHYIHTTPDIYEPDAVVQLVTEELKDAYLQPRSMSEHKGNTLAVVVHPTARLAKTILAFPAGRLGQELNFSPFIPRSNARSHGKLQDRFLLAPSSETFPTPILQINTSPQISPHRLDSWLSQELVSLTPPDQATALTVRLASSTHLLKLVPTATYLPPAVDRPASPTRVAELSISDTEGRQHVDVELDPHIWTRAAIVDEGGAVWLWHEVVERLGGRVEKTMKLIKIREELDSQHDGFFRVAFGTREDTLLVLSRNTLVSLDIASMNMLVPTTTLLTLNGHTDQFTGLDKSAAGRRAEFICVFSEKELLWVGDGCKSNPVLRWAHNLGGSGVGSLECVVVPAGRPQDRLSDIVIVSSATQGSIEAIEVSTDYPARLLSAPWALGGVTQALSSMVLLPFQGRDGDEGFINIIGATDRGSLRLVRLESTQSSHELLPRSTTELEVLENPRRDLLLDEAMTFSHKTIEEPGQLEWSSKAETRHDTLHARWAWSIINDLEAPTFRAVALQQILREFDVPGEHLFLTAEIARDEICVPVSGRSTLLRRLNIMEDRPMQIANQCLEYGSLDYSAMISDCVESSSDINLKHQREEGRLRRDLDLSAFVSVPDSMEKALGSILDPPRTTADEAFAAAASQLSLEERPSDLFTVLIPIAPLPGLRAPDLSAAKGLLGEWEPLRDARQHRWQPPAAADHPAQSSSRSNRPIRPLPPIKSLHSTVAASQPSVPNIGAVFPPLSVDSASRSVPTVLPKLSAHPMSRSSPPPSAEESLTSAFPLTQVERGPFGARPEASRAARKKILRKRQGGF